MSTTTTTTATRRSAAGHPGPPLGAPAITAAVTFLAAVLIGPLTGAGVVPSPFADTRTVDGYYAAHPVVTTVGGLLTILSAVALAFLSALVLSRLTFLAPNAPGPVIGAVGGLAAAATLGLSGLLTWTMSRDVVTAQPGLTHALHYLGFAAGGPVHAAALGVLCLGVAVTAIFLRRTPRLLSHAGIGLAAVDLLALVALLAPAAAPLVPVGRFLSLAWLVAICLLLPRDRTARRRA